MARTLSTMTTFIAVTGTDVLIWLGTCVAMAAVGYVVWKLVQRQESRDSAFQQKLDDDDTRANRNGGS